MCRATFECPDLYACDLCGELLVNVPWKRKASFTWGFVYVAEKRHGSVLPVLGGLQATCGARLECP